MRYPRNLLCSEKEEQDENEINVVLHVTILIVFLKWILLLFVSSEYPAQRSKKDSEGMEMGVAGSVSLLQNVTLSTQPISSLDWSPDKSGLCVCSAFDQTVRVLIVTKLNKI